MLFFNQVINLIQITQIDKTIKQTFKDYNLYKQLKIELFNPKTKILYTARILLAMIIGFSGALIIYQLQKQGQLLLSTVIYIIELILGAIIMHLVYIRHSKINVIGYINILEPIYSSQNLKNIISKYPNYKVINIPTNLDKVIIIDNCILIYQKKKLLTIINRNDSNFNEQKFWQMHNTPLKTFLNSGDK